MNLENNEVCWWLIMLLVSYHIELLFLCKDYKEYETKLFKPPDILQLVNYRSKTRRNI